MNTKFSEQGSSSHTDGTLRQTSSSSLPAEKLQGKGGHLRYLIGIVCCAAVLALGIGEHYATVVPLEKELLSREVHSLAQEIDAAVKIRSSVIAIAAGTVEVDAILANGRLDRFLATLREHLPDFLSLEIISDRGEVVAMIGDLPLSQAGMPGQARANRFVRVSSDIKSNEGVFVDDPANGCFSVTCRHIGPEKGRWYSRSRFSRDFIEQLLSSFPNRKVALVQVTGGPKSARLGHGWNVAATSGGWWQGADKAEALLASPGWLARVENTSNRSALRSLPVLVPAILLCVVVIAFFARMFSSRTVASQPEQNATGSQPCLHDKDEVVGQDGLDEACASPESAAIAQQSNKHASDSESGDSPAASATVSLECAFPCCATVAIDPAQGPDASTSREECPEASTPSPEEIELPEDHFAISVASSEVSVTVALESLEYDADPELTLDEAAALCGETEIIVGEPFSIELEFPEESVGSDPAQSSDAQRPEYYSAVILGPPASAPSCPRGRETLQKAKDEDFPETIELSWSEPAEVSARGGKPIEHDYEEPTKDKKPTEATRWHGQYTS